MITKEYKVKIWFEKETNLFVITADKGNKKGFVTTQGKTFVEAFKMLGDAIELMEDLKEKRK